MTRARGELFKHYPELRDLLFVATLVITYWIFISLLRSFIKNKFSISKTWNIHLRKVHAAGGSSFIAFGGILCLIWIAIVMTPEVCQIIIKYSKMLINFFS